MDGSNKKTKGFFKLFTPETSSQKMEMPPAVSAYMGDKLPRTVFLRDRYKNMWEVKVGRSGNHLVFEEGWDKFIKDNCVELGDFLVFDYLDTKSLFDFKLLGLSCCCEKIGVGRPNFLVKEEVEWEHSDSLEEDEEEEEEGDPSYHTTINENNMSEDDEYEFAEVEVEEEEEDGDGDGESRIEAAPRRNHHKRKAFDYTGASIFESGLYPQPINPYFVAKNRKGRKNELHIPEYVIRHFNLKLPSTMILRDPKGKDWEAKVNPWKDGRVVLTGGWNALCKWNLIREEDSCICEFVTEERGMGRKELLLQIQVVRGSHQA
ncbi:PREDICTED: B3 domain-containing protein REM5-like [Ipomoea nil]|uniref:B3 domain-containing protein REM5-like n=1 Tax=Ipomoea nil TaxID=35883 RepID=UPI000901B991|nr:PREDICTED: B3 domain-containing protein REM5-like [Ipomoea nil]